MTKLRIGVDGLNLALPLGGGVATYAYTLGQVLAGAGHSIEGIFGLPVGRDPGGRMARLVAGLRNPPPPPTRRSPAGRATLYLRAARPFAVRRACAVPLAHGLRTLPDHRLPPFSRLWSMADLFAVAHRHFLLHRRFMTLAVNDPPDIMHWTYPVPIRLEGARNIYTLHDLVPLRLPAATRDDKPLYERLVRRCATTAAHICTVSEASRRDIVALLGIGEDRVTDTGQAVLAEEPPASEAEDATELRSTYGLERGGYFLFVGTIEPKKNVARLIDAYLSLATTTPLVLAGAAGWQADAALANDAGDRVIRLGYVPRAMLARLIRSAKALAFPSLIEGFGLPVLEALQAGTPVLTSDTGSLPEIAGEAAVLVDPYDVAAIAGGLRALDGDAALRTRLRREGPVRARLFLPERYLARLERMYAGVLAADEMTG